MILVKIVSDATSDGGPTFRAVSGDMVLRGKTIGQALDNILPQIPGSEWGPLLVFPLDSLMQDNRKDSPSERTSK